MLMFSKTQRVLASEQKKLPNQRVTAEEQKKLPNQSVSTEEQKKLSNQSVSIEEQKKLPYLIKVNRYYNTITIYGLDDKGEYTIPVKAMVCSVGTDYRTVPGTFKTIQKYRWKELMGKVYGQYSTRIVKGILFHSVYYYQNENPASLATAEYNKLGNAASHGCIRLAVIDAKWIYDNCELGTTVVIYDDKKSPGPLGKPKKVKMTMSVRWDPTDPDEKNPYVHNQRIKQVEKQVEKPVVVSILPKIEGLKDVELAWGETIDLRKGVTAKSTLGKDITSLLEIEGKVNSFVPGIYEISYSVEDERKCLKMKFINVTVGECPENPVITGVSDKVENSNVVIDEKYAMKGVTAFCKNTQLDNKLISVNIEKKSETEYYITYNLTLGNKSATANATIKINPDTTAPDAAVDNLKNEND
jgi:lipoprotein-anchoring transpeptidase ErfK/SrfK